MERESKKQKTDTEDQEKQKTDTEKKEENKPLPEYYTEPAVPTYRTPPFEFTSTDNFGATTVHTQYAMKD
jgi:hypothetical protein